MSLRPVRADSTSALAPSWTARHAHCLGTRKKFLRLLAQRVTTRLSVTLTIYLTAGVVYIGCYVVRPADRELSAACKCLPWNSALHPQ